MPAQTAKGLLLKYLKSDGTWGTIGQVEDVNRSGVVRSIHDSTTHDSSNRWRDFVVGIKDHGSLEFSIVYDPLIGETKGHSWLSDTALFNNDRHLFHLVYSGSISFLVFDGVVTGFVPVNATGSAIRGNIGIKYSHNYTGEESAPDWKLLGGLDWLMRADYEVETSGSTITAWNEVDRQWTSKQISNTPQYTAQVSAFNNKPGITFNEANPDRIKYGYGKPETDGPFNAWPCGGYIVLYSDFDGSYNYIYASTATLYYQIYCTSAAAFRSNNHANDFILGFGTPNSDGSSALLCRLDTNDAYAWTSTQRTYDTSCSSTGAPYSSFSIGASNSALTQGFNGSIAEFGGWDSRPTPEQLNKTAAYLMLRYNIPLIGGDEMNFSLLPT